LSSALAACHSIADLRLLARQKLPKVFFDYIDGAAEDEITMQRNSAGFNRYALLPRVLTDVTGVNLATTIQGLPSDLPLVLSPTGGQRLFHHLGELAVLPVAEREKLIFTLSSMATHNIETAAAAAGGHKWFQIYVWKDRGVVREFIERCRAAGYKALCLTVDVQTSGQRERDLRNGFTLPPKFTAASLFDMALHPQWWWHTLSKPTITLANVAGKTGKSVENATSMGQYAASQLDPAVTWDDLAWMIEQWGGPFLVKGISRPDDALRAVNTGATGVIISNHGGRQLDHSIAAIDALPAIVDAVGDRTEILLDGGIRRGTDIIKALALGAKACMIGRPYLYGLAAGGQPGVQRAVDILKGELLRGMMLLGCDDINTLSKAWLQEHPRSQ
jgi:L-lactate dehydrogenase (cytochrome)